MGVEHYYDHGSVSCHDTSAFLDFSLLPRTLRVQGKPSAFWSFKEWIILEEY
jgi:hypothetical protein